MKDDPEIAMQELHEDHSAALWAFCLHLTGNDRARAEDVAQETMLRAWRNSAVLTESRGSVRSSWVVAEALTSLSADHRAVLVECYYRGRPVAEVARRLGVPQGTVKSRTHYALRALRLALEEMGVVA